MNVCTLGMSVYSTIVHDVPAGVNYYCRFIPDAYTWRLAKAATRHAKVHKREKGYVE